MNQQMNQDLDHLKTLSICHYILAGLCVFPMLYGLFFLVIGLFVGTIFSSIPHRPGEPSPEIVGSFVGGFYAILGLIISGVALTMGILLLKSGRNLTSRNSHTFSFVVACISCIFVRLGTVLGIFTLVVLTKDSVKSLFNGQNFQSYGNTPPNWQ